MLPGGVTIVMVGDVVGHDIQAAGLTGQLRSILRPLARAVRQPASAMVAQLDRAIAELHTEVLAALITATIEPDPPAGSDGDAAGDMIKRPST